MRKSLVVTLVSSLVATWLGAASVQAAPCDAQSFPPIARFSLAPEEPLVGQEIRLLNESVDPDGCPMVFDWEFGDGGRSSDAEPVHKYGAPGVYRVRLTVTNGSDTAVAEQSVYVLLPPTPMRPSQSGPLALDPGGRELWVVNPDSDTVTVVDTGSLRAVIEIPVGRNPRTVALSSDGTGAYVACQESNGLWVLDRIAREVRATVTVGHRPYGVALVPTDGRILITNQGSGALTILSPTDLSLVATLPLPPDPRAVAVTADGRDVFVSHYLTRGDAGSVTRIDLSSMSVAGRVDLVEDPGPDTPSSGRGFPNLLSALAIDPAGQSAWVGGLKSNTSAGLFREGMLQGPKNLVRGFFGPVHIASGREDLPRRIDTNDADSASAIAFSPSGRHAYVAHQGAGTVSVYDVVASALSRPGDGGTVPFRSRLEVGDAPQGLAVSPDGRRLYVSSYLGRGVTVVDVVDPAGAKVVATIPVTAEPLTPTILNGKRMFFRSAAPRHSASSYVACASCHPDGGGSDGRTWDFTQRGEGLRNTKDLRGRAGLADGPVHWSANFDEIQDFERDIVEHFGGTGLAGDGLPPNPPFGPPNAGRSQDLDDLAAYVASLAIAPPSPFRDADGRLSPAARRGRDIFGRIGCPECHPGPRYTTSALRPDAGDPLLYDVGTLTPASGARLGDPLRGLDTPSLVGLWDSPPYLHDGRAPSLRDVFLDPGNLMGQAAANLSTAQLDDLVAYLLSIDGRPDDPMDAGCGCSFRANGPRDESLPAALATLAVLLRRRSRKQRVTGSARIAPGNSRGACDRIGYMQPTTNMFHTAALACETDDEGLHVGVSLGALEGGPGKDRARGRAPRAHGPRVQREWGWHRQCAARPGFWRDRHR